MSFSVLSNLYQRLLFLLPFTSEPFNYDDPTQWYTDFPQCLGFRQSPISINAYKALDIILPPLLFGFYDIPLIEPPILHNNGHTIEFEVPESVLHEKPFITGGLLEEVYQAEGVHFHWGSATKKGSEHMMNGRRYDLEMHIVHRNLKYANVEVARDFDDGLAVLAVLFKVVKSPNVYYPGLNEIYSVLDELIEFNSTASTLIPITLGSLLGAINRDDFFTYEGSLTTPPCSESVTWHVFAGVVPISFTELLKFWNIFDSRRRRLINNFRPLQYMEHRKVYHRRPTPDYIF